METPTTFTQHAPAEAEKHPVKKVLVIVSKGTPEDVYAGLIMANGALMEGMEAKMFFTFFGLDAIRKDRQDRLHTLGTGNPTFLTMHEEMEKLDIPPVSEFLEMIVAGGGEIYGCKLAVEMFKIEEDDLIDDLAGVITVGDMYALAEGAGAQIIFI